MDNQSLVNSIENLYTVFAKYPLKEIFYSPLGQRGEFVANLYKTPLRELTSDDMDYYSYKAINANLFHIEIYLLYLLGLFFFLDIYGKKHFLTLCLLSLFLLLFYLIHIDNFQLL